MVSDYYIEKHHVENNTWKENCHKLMITLQTFPTSHANTVKP